VRRLIGASVAVLTCGCAHIPWANDPSAEPPKVCGAKAPAPYAQSLYCRGLYAAAAASFAEDLSGENPQGELLRRRQGAGNAIDHAESSESIALGAD